MRSTRDTGVPWLGDIPEHWDVSRLKFETTHIVDCLHATPPYDPEGEFPAIRTADVEPGRLLLDQAYRLTTENYLRWTERLVPVEGDVLYTREGERFGIAASVPTGVRLCISQRMMLFRIRPDRDSTYFMWQLNARHVYEQASEDQVGAAAPHVNVEKIQNFRLLVPPLDEQRDIVDRIVRETSRTDALLDAKRRLLDLLAEKRKAIVATAVTRGLDPKVKLRDSGVPWLGEFPAHWEHRNLRFCCTAIQTGGTPNPEFLDYDGDDGLDWLTPGDFSEALVLQRSTRRVAPGALEAGDLKRFPAGAVLVVGIGATLGKVGLLSRPASANQQVNALIPRDNIDSSYLAYEMSVLAELLRASANTATLPILNQQRMGDVPVLIPPIAEQRAIVEHIARGTAKLDAVRSATERTIALLKERRSALIATAVTGQLDVATAA